MDRALPVLAGKGELDEVVLWGGVIPERETETALMLQGGALHALARHDPPVAHVLGRAVGHDGDRIAALPEPDAELKASMAASDNTNGTHPTDLLPAPHCVSRA